MHKTSYCTRHHPPTAVSYGDPTSKCNEVLHRNRPTMAIAFNPNEDQREGAPTASNGSVPPDPQSPLVFHHGHGSSSSGGSSQSTSASSSTNSSPGAVSGPIPVPQLLHQQYAAQQPTLYYYPHNSGSTQMPPQSPVLQTPIYRQYNNEELIQAICEALHRCSNGSCANPATSQFSLLVLIVLLIVKTSDFT